MSSMCFTTIHKYIFLFENVKGKFNTDKCLNIIKILKKWQHMYPANIEAYNSSVHKILTLIEFIFKI